MLFGREALQCALRFHHKHRRWAEIVGERHECLEWDDKVDPLNQGVGVPLPLYTVKDTPSEEELAAPLEAGP